MRELQTALGLVAADVGICVVPAGVSRFRRDNVDYIPLDEPGAAPDLSLLVRIIEDLYLASGITFGQ